MSTDLTGTVWKSNDKRETRHVRVERTDSSYAYVIGCEPNGTPHTNGRRSRVLLNAYRDGLRGYRRPAQVRP